MTIWRKINKLTSITGSVKLNHFLLRFVDALVSGSRSIMVELYVTKCLVDKGHQEFRRTCLWNRGVLSKHSMQGFLSGNLFFIEPKNSLVSAESLGTYSF